MASALIYLVVVLVAAAVVYLLAAVVFGRGEELEALQPGATPTRLPASDVEGSDVRALKFQQAFRGYRTGEVDWALERMAGEVDELRGRIATLERQLDLAGEQLRQERDPEPPDPGPPEQEPPEQD